MSRAVAAVAALAAALFLANPAQGAALQPEVEQALQALVDGDVSRARVMARALVERDPPPQGAISVWLAAGAEAEHDAWRFHVDDHLAEPRLHALAARRARQLDDRATAARHVAFGLQLGLADGLLVAEARALGWDVPDAPPRALPGPAAVTASGDPWLILAIFVLLVGLVVAARSRDWRAGLGLVVGLAVAAQAGRVPVQPRPELPPQLRSPSTLVRVAADCEALPTFAGWDGLLISQVCADGTYAHVNVVAADGRERGVTHHVWKGEGGGAASEALQVAVTTAVADAESEGFRLTTWLQGWTTVAARDTGAWPVGGEAGQVAFAGLLVIAAILMALLTLPSLLSSLAPLLARGAPWRGMLAMGLAGLAVVHAFVPDHLVMSFGVYEVEPSLVEPRVLRYGPGAIWFYGPLQWLMGADHAWILLLNRVFGALSALTAVGLAARLFSRPAVPALAACLLATLPVLWLAHTSESILVGPTWVMLTALWLALDPSPRPAFVSVALGLGAAALSRPEMAVAVGAAPFVIALLRGRERTTGWASMAVLVLAVVGLEAAWLVDKASQMHVSGSLDFAREGGLATLLWNMGGVLGAHDIFLNPAMTPTVLVIGLVAAVARRDTRWRSAWLLAWGVVWMMATTVDLTAVSIPRLQLPVLLLLIPVVAAGLDQALLVDRAPARRRVLVAGFVSLYVIGGGVNAWWLLQPDNAASEEQLWRDTVAALPADQPGCLVTLGHADKPDGGLTSRHVPDYLLAARAAPWTVDDLYRTEIVRERCEGPTWALLGVRCYVHLRRPDEPAPPGAPELEGCATFRQSWQLRAVFERELVNHGDRDYAMYPAGGPLEVGLYEVTGPSAP